MRPRVHQRSLLLVGAAGGQSYGDGFRKPEFYATLRNKHSSLAPKTDLVILSQRCEDLSCPPRTKQTNKFGRTNFLLAN